jgi:hypothetical protein
MCGGKTGSGSDHSKGVPQGSFDSIWHPMGMVTFNVIGENLFMAEFEYEEDKTRILESRPWIFDGDLVALADFDGLTSPEELNFDYASL